MANWLYEDEEFDAEYPTIDAGGTVADEAADLTRIEGHLRAAARLTEDVARIREHAEMERSRISHWEQARIAPIQRRLDWHEQSMRAWLWNSGKKSAKLVWGALKRTAGRESLAVADEAAAIEWARTHLPAGIRTKESIDKRTVMAAIKSGATKGEIPPGCDIAVGEDSFSWAPVELTPEQSLVAHAERALDPAPVPITDTDLPY